jgi:hypothetical protein
MAREIFNPGFSLFVNVPEGGTTFQPNPNSMVQNDPGRGTTHLDYFKFVGHVIGKALYDGQLADAYFTRSFYKHMLGMPVSDFPLYRIYLFPFCFTFDLFLSSGLILHIAQFSADFLYSC